MIYSKVGNRGKWGYVPDALKPATNSKRGYWFHIVLASAAYIVAQIADYLFTVYGITNNMSQEANPVVLGYMEAFGVGRGLVICKSLMCTIIIFAVIVAHLACRRKGSRIRVDLFLYAGSIMTLLGGGLWLTRF